MSVVIEICVKYPGGPTLMKATEIDYTGTGRPQTPLGAWRCAVPIQYVPVLCCRRTAGTITALVLLIARCSTVPISRPRCSIVYCIHFYSIYCEL
jgi:hypothetical protein